MAKNNVCVFQLNSLLKSSHSSFTKYELKNVSINGGCNQQLSHSPATLKVTGSRPGFDDILEILLSNRYCLRHKQSDVILVLVALIL